MREVKAGTRFEILEITRAVALADAVRELFLEYGESLGFNTCFGGFDQELATLPGDYAPPRGCLLLATADVKAAGCVGARPLDATSCEMKRLFVRVGYRNVGLGRRLAEFATARARTLGYRRMCLDTLPNMRAARALYAALGFTPCAPYDDDSCLGSDCFALDLLPA